MNHFNRENPTLRVFPASVLSAVPVYGCSYGMNVGAKRHAHKS